MVFSIGGSGGSIFYLSYFTDFTYKSKIGITATAATTIGIHMTMAGKATKQLWPKAE